MAEVLILGGRAGALLPRMAQEIGQAYALGRKAVLLVPQQYTLQAERELITRLKLPGFFDIEVLSPSRLRRKVTELAGEGALPVLDSPGRAMVWSMALQEKGEELRYYRSVSARAGLPARLMAVTDDLADVGVVPEQLSALAGECTGAAAYKLGDIALLWQSVQAITAGTALDNHEREQETLARLPESGLMNDALVWVYGFDFLNESLCDVLCATARLCAGMTVGMVMGEPDAPDHRIFQAQHRSVGRLREKLMVSRSCTACKTEYLQAPSGDRAPELEYLERQLFNRSAAPWPGNEPVNGLRIHTAMNAAAEAAWAASLLLERHAQGVPWNRMAVALPSAPTPLLCQTLQACEVPAFVVRKTSILRHGLVRLLISALRAVSGGWLCEDVLEMARSGFSLLSRDEACLMENYAITNGIRGNRWLKPFTRGADAADMEPLRQRLIGPVQQMHDRLKEAKDADASAAAVFMLLEDCGCADRLLQTEQELLDAGFAGEADMNRQVWKKLLGLLDEFHLLLKGERATLQKTARLLQAGLQTLQIAALPQAGDAVLVGECGHLMPGSLDLLIVMGMQDGVMSTEKQSLLSEAEQTMLTGKLNLPIGLSPREEASLRLSDFYRTFALPQKELVLTCAAGTLSGEGLRPAAVLGTIKTLFHGCVKDQGGVSSTGFERPVAPVPALEGLASRLKACGDQPLTPEWEDALRLLDRDPESHRPATLMLASLTPAQDIPPLPQPLASRLFGQERISISKLQLFAGCPYAHFVRYGLRPVPRLPFEFSPADKGNFYHEVLSRFFDEIIRTGQIPSTEDDTDELLNEILKPVTANWENGPLREDGLGELQGRDTVRAVRRTAQTLCSQLKHSAFRPAGTELSFGTGTGDMPALVLHPRIGPEVALEGRIDRLDTMQADGRVYDRLIDYKSGSRSFEPTRFYAGTQLQLMLYLRAVQQARHSIAAAGLYMRVQDPRVDTEDDPQKADEAVGKVMLMDGIVLNDPLVLQAMDTDPAYASTKVKLNKDGTPSKASPVVPKALLEQFLNDGERMAESEICGLRRGRIDQTPVRYSDTADDAAACAYCDAAAICTHDPQTPGCRWRDAAPYKLSDLVKRYDEEQTTPSLPDFERIPGEKP